MDKKPRQSVKKVLSNIFRIVIHSARLAPDYFILVIVEGIIWGAINASEAVFTVHLFDALDQGAPFSQLAAIIGIMAAFYLFAYGFDAIYYQHFYHTTRMKLETRLHKELLAKSGKLDIACYDDPAFYDDFVWAMDKAGGRCHEVMANIGKLINRLVALGTLITLMLSIDPWICLALVLTSLICTLVHLKINQVNYELNKDLKPLQRAANYLNRVFHQSDHAKEIRTSAVTELLMDQMDEITDKSVKTRRKAGLKQFFLSRIYALAKSACYYGALIYMLLQLVEGNVGMGGFAAGVGVVWRVLWMLEDLVIRLTNFPKHSMFLEKYYTFLAYEPKIRGEKKADVDFDELEVRDLSFCYDFSEMPKNPAKAEKKAEKEGALVLKDVSLKLKKGEKIAIVGYNGAGKTTLIKLLLRLYDPSRGQILLNGVDIREYDPRSYRDNFGVVFQDFKIFAAALGQNVMNGYYRDQDEQTVREALDAAGFSQRLQKMSKGVDTALTKEFDKEGVELSGGEGQKVAISRVFAVPNKIIIMDEPSSALDPVAEYELNQAILQYAADKTVIFISHRLSTTRMADRIYMFDGGSLIEVGSHDELMAKRGKYAEMFDLQAEKYKLKKA